MQQTDCPRSLPLPFPPSVLSSAIHHLPSMLAAAHHQSPAPLAASMPNLWQQHHHQQQVAPAGRGTVPPSAVPPCQGLCCRLPPVSVGQQTFPSCFLSGVPAAASADPRLVAASSAAAAAAVATNLYSRPPVLPPYLLHSVGTPVQSRSNEVPPAHVNTRGGGGVQQQQRGAYHLPDVSQAPSLLPFGLSRPHLGALPGLGIPEPVVTHTTYDSSQVCT